MNTPKETKLKKELPKPDSALVDRPRMGKYSNVAEGGEDLLIRIMDWLAGKKSFWSIFGLDHKKGVLP